MVQSADNYVKNLWNIAISNPKPDLHNMNAYTKFGENPLIYTEVIIRKRKCGRVGQITLSKTEKSAHRQTGPLQSGSESN